MITNSNQLQKSLSELKKEQQRIEEAIRVLESLVSGAKANRLSPEGRARISEAARKRWDEHRRKAGKAVGSSGRSSSHRHAA